MVSIQYEKAACAVVARQHPEDMIVDRLYDVKGAIFLELIAIAQFNISKTMVIIILKCSKAEILILKKIIVISSISPVAVTEQDITGACGQG